MKLLWMVLLILISGFSMAAPLQGAYSVGGTAPDYPGIREAALDVSVQGISGPVTFNIRPGIYDDIISLSAIARSGASDDVVAFIATPGTVIIKKNFPGTPETILMDINADYISIDGLDFETTGNNVNQLLSFSGTGLTVQNSTFTGEAASSHETLIQIASFSGDISMTNSTVNFGGVGVKGIGISAPISFEGNTFVGQFDEALNILVQRHDVETVRVVNNSFTDATWTGLKRGVIVAGETKMIIRQNLIQANKWITGLFVEDDNNALSPGGTENLIFNNMISMHSSNATQGIYLVGDFANVYHNTINVSSSATADAFYNKVVPEIDGQLHPTGQLKLKNNIFTNNGSGFAVRIDHTDSLDQSDFNVYWVSNNNYFSIDGQAYNFNDLQGQLQSDLYSRIIDVEYVDEAVGNLHIGGLSIGNGYLGAPKLAQVGQDLDGQTRPDVTYRGADQSTALALPLNNADTSSGFYTVGGSSPDYIDLHEAVDQMNRRGISGEVTFRIRSGIYFTINQIDFYRYSGAETSLVKLIAANPNARPELKVGGGPYHYRLFNVHDIEFNSLDFSTGAVNPLNHMISFNHFTHDIRIENCTFMGSTFGGTSNTSILFDDGGTNSAITVINNQFDRGSFAIDWGGDPLNPTTGNLIEGNTMNNQVRGGIRALNQSINIRSNLISSGVDSNGNYIGLEVGSHGSQLVGNAILSEKGPVLMKVSGGLGGAQIVNNFLRANDHALLNEALDVSADNIDVFANSISMNSSSNPSATGIRINDFAQQVNLRNNIVQSQGAYALVAPQAIDSDSNVFFSDTTLVNYNGVDYDFAQYQVISGLDANSKNLLSYFVNENNGDLHLTGLSNGNHAYQGVVLAAVSEDIDGDVRSALPYIGADEAGAYAEVLVTATEPLQISDSGASDTFEVVLASQPLSDVMIDMSVDSAAQASLTPESLSFTNANWQTPQTVSISGLDDAIIQEGVQNMSVLFANAVSSDSNYSGMPTSSINAESADTTTAFVSIQTIQDGIEGSADGIYHLSLDNGVVTAADLSIPGFSFGGSASNGSDYLFNLNDFKILAGQSEADLTMLVVDDAFNEPLENIDLLLTTTDYGLAQVNPQASSARIVILDDDNSNSADLGISISNAQDIWAPGSMISYEIQVINNGPDDIPAALIFDQFPQALSNVSWTCQTDGFSSCVSQGLGDLSQLVSLPDNSQLTFSVQAVFNGTPGTAISNTARIILQEDDPVTSNNQATESDQIDFYFKDGFEE